MCHIFNLLFIGIVNVTFSWRMNVTKQCLTSRKYGNEQSYASSISKPEIESGPWWNYSIARGLMLQKSYNVKVNISSISQDIGMKMMNSNIYTEAVGSAITQLPLSPWRYWVQFLGSNSINFQNLWWLNSTSTTQCIGIDLVLSLLCNTSQITSHKPVQSPNTDNEHSTCNSNSCLE